MHMKFYHFYFFYFFMLMKKFIPPAANHGLNRNHEETCTFHNICRLDKVSPSVKDHILLIQDSPNQIHQDDF
jgi:hypothetical protein